MSDLPVGAVLFEGVSKRYRLGTLGTLRSFLEALTARGAGGSREFWALRDVSFRVEPGESLGIIGPNGAGKTTTLKLLSNITQPTSGRVAVGGRISSLIELGAGFHPELTGRENIFLNGAILGLSRREIQRKLDAIIAFSELERFIDTPVKRYSSGMYVRLGFAVAAHVEPDVLLVDEVLAVGDAAFRQKSMALMHSIRRKGTTVVFVSHNMHLVQSLCTRALLLSQGRAVADGPSEMVIAAYERQHFTERSNEASLGQDGAAMLYRADVYNGSGELCTEFQHGNSIRLGILYSAMQPVVSPIVRVRLIGDEGAVVAMVASHHQDARPFPTLSGSGAIGLLIGSLEVGTGSYHFEIRLLDGTDSQVLAMINSPEFYVASPGFGYEVDRGMYRPKVAWSLTAEELDV